MANAKTAATAKPESASYVIEGNTLVMRLPLAPEPPASKSGKSRIAFSTGGFQAIPVIYQGATVKVGINVMLPL